METATQENPANDFINNLSASMAAMPIDEYVSKHGELLKNLDNLNAFVDKFVKIPVTAENFEKYYKVKSMLGSLYCFAFNNNDKQWERVGDIESKLWKQMYKFAFTLARNITDSKTKSLVRYVLWRQQTRRYYTSEKTAKLAAELVAKEVVFRYHETNDNEQRTGFTRYVIVGLHLAVGDNTFTVGQTGQYRNYCKVCVPQAFYIYDGLAEAFKNFDSEIKDLPSYYKLQGLGDYKGGSKVTFTRADKHYVNYEFFR